MGKHSLWIIAGVAFVAGFYWGQTQYAAGNVGLSSLV
jgi:hypothetical protein